MSKLLIEALENTQSLLVKIFNLGMTHTSELPSLWVSEELGVAIEEQAVENRVALDSMTDITVATNNVTPTIEEVLNRYMTEYSHMWIVNPERVCMIAMKEYAQQQSVYHVEKGLQKASEEVDKAMEPTCDDHSTSYGTCCTCGSYGNPDIIRDEKKLKESILNAYKVPDL